MVEVAFVVFPPARGGACAIVVPPGAVRASREAP